MKHTKQILIVFPGLGKTTIAKKRPNFADVDYGYLRAAMKSTDDVAICRVVTKLINIYAKEGFRVLTNEPKLIPWLKQLDAKIIMVLPREGVPMDLRILEREKAHPVNMQFAQQYAKHWKTWVTAWKQSAIKYGISIVEVEFLNEDWRVVKDALQNS